MSGKRRSKASLTSGGASSSPLANGVDGAVATRRRGEVVRRCRGACGAETDGDGYCATCHAWSPYPNGNSPRRWCPTHGTWSVGLDGWCQPANHVVGPRLDRTAGWLYVPAEIPVADRAANQARVHALLASIGQRVPPPMTEGEWEARRAVLRAQAEALRAREPGDEEGT